MADPTASPATAPAVPPPPRRRRWMALLLGVPAAGLLAALAILWLLWVGPGPAQRPVTVVVESGSTLARVAYQLEAAGAIRGGATGFRGFARLLGSSDPVQAGEFRIPPRASAAAILELLQ